MKGSQVVVPIRGLDAAARHALAHARKVGAGHGSVMAVCVADTAADAEQLRREWDHSAPDAELVIIEAPAQRATTSLLAYLEMLRSSDSSRELKVVLPRSAPEWQRSGIVVETIED